MQNFFQPIEIYPTQTQIESATRHVRYNDIITPINTSCPISLESFNDNDMVTVIRHCGHIFKSDQLNTWFRSNCRCPVCRYDIRRYNSTTSTEFFNSNESSVQPANSIPDANPIPAANSIPAANPIASTNSIPLTDPDINSTNSNHERSNPTTSGRTNNALLFFNTILDSFSNSNDINVSDINVSDYECK